MGGKHIIPTLASLLSSPGRPFIHRDLSWLQFNERVLAEARTSSNPLLERVKFLAITASNLDEFFMIRFSSLGRSISSAARKSPGEKRHLIRLRSLILERVAAFNAKQAETLEILASLLDGDGVSVVYQPGKDDPAHAAGKRVFDEHILSALPNPAQLPSHPWGLLENLQMACVFKDEIWFPVPRRLPLAFLAPASKNGAYVFFLDDLLRSHLGPHVGLAEAPGLVRLTRDADIIVDLADEDPATIPDVIRSGVRHRERGRPVRIQYGGDFGDEFLSRNVAKLNFSPGQAIPAPNTFCLQGLWRIVREFPDEKKTKASFSYPPLQPFVMRLFEPSVDIFDELKKRDILFHHPYDGFDAYVRWIQAAADDPKVELIQQTVYRTDVFSPVLETLKAAARKKRVRVVIELRARFDELNNLRLADELRKEGIEVAFGFGKLKIHAKVASVRRREEEGPRYYTHLSTGNYNTATAREYEDLAVLTSNPELGEDVNHFFDSVCAAKVPSAFKTLVPAPSQLHRLLLGLIREETQAAQEGKPARIVAKVNALVDESIIETLYEASQAGVQVDLIVRGACSLIPGVKNLSDKIRVVSVVDRFLEHSRIYYFAHAKKMYLSSADWMPRNFFSRMEIAFPVLDPHIYRYIQEVVIPVYLADTVKARELTPQGTWKKRTLSSPGVRQQLSPAFTQAVRSQFYFNELAKAEYRGTPLSRAAAAAAKPPAETPGAQSLPDGSR